MKRAILVGLIGAGALFAANAARAGIIEDFQFGDADGTLLGGAVNSANGGNNWLVHANTVDSAVAAGDFRIRKQSQPGQANNSLEMANVATGKVWLVAEISGWHYTATASTPSERMRFAFLDNDPAAVGTSTVTAEMTIDRSGSGLILSGEALGTGFTAVANDYAMPLTRTTPMTIVLELNKNNDTYSVHYRDGGPTFTLLGTGDLGMSTFNSGDRDGNSIRFAFTGTFGDAEEYFDVDRIYLTNMNPIPEPSSVLLAVFSLVGWAWYRRTVLRNLV